MTRGKRKHADELPAPRRHLESQPDARSTEVIGDGFYAGFRTDEILRALADGVHSLFSGEDGEGERSITGGQGVDLAVAGAALDLALGEYLGMVQISIGDHNAKLAALAFCDTALPYATLPTPIVSTYADALKIRGHRK